MFTLQKGAGALGLSAKANGDGAMSGLESLALAYQDIATRYVEKQVAAFETLSSVKTPMEFFLAQQKLLKDGLDGAVADCQIIAELTASAFTAAFRPVRKQIAAI